MRTNVIEALLTVASEQAEALTEHAVTLVNAMLKNSRPQEFTSPVGFCVHCVFFGEISDKWLIADVESCLAQMLVHIP